MTFSLGIIGDGTMGTHLARNAASHGERVLVLGHHQEKLEKMKEEAGQPEGLEGTTDLSAFLEQLEKPRVIMLLIPAGKPVAEMSATLLPLLEKGDILLDLGNSHYKETAKRQETFAAKGLSFIGAGLSGGEEGALKGASIMPGGDAAAISKILPLLEKLAAKDFEGRPTTTYVGMGSAGHAVKMIHNGIEYAIMQMISELYGVLKHAYHLDGEAAASFFTSINEGPLRSFLLEKAIQVLGYKDEKTGADLVKVILDKAGQKGTGMWTSQTGLETGVPISIPSSAVEARVESSFKDIRQKLATLFPSSVQEPRESLDSFTKTARDGLLTGIILTFSQGIWLMRELSRTHQWDMNLQEIMRIWQGGCIIRMKLLEELSKDKVATAEHLLEVDSIRELMNVDALRKVTETCIHHHVSCPTFSSSLAYVDNMTSEVTTANLIQGIRDAFGSHTFERNDMEGTYHINWTDHE